MKTKPQRILIPVKGKKRLSELFRERSLAGYGSSGTGKVIIEIGAGQA